MRRPSGFAAAAVGLLLLDVGLRLALGDPYVGATALLIAASGLSLVPFLPRELATLSVRLALVPTLGLGSFALLLTSVSLVGIELTELSIRVAAAALVVAAGSVFLLVRSRPPSTDRSRGELLATVALVAVFAFSFASSYDVVEPFPPPGTDWAHNLQYADQVEAQGGLLIEDPFRGDEAPVFANPPGGGAAYGSMRILDGVSSRSLARGIAVFSAFGAVSVYAAVAGLWGVTAGLLAATAYAVAPIRLETMYWHGLGTTLGLVFIPLVVLALGLMYRGGRDRRTIALLGFSVAAVCVFHPASALVVALLLALVLLASVPRLRGVSLREWWETGMARPVLAGVVVAAVAGAGAVVHVGRQSHELGSLVGFGAFDRDWLSLDIVEYYFSWPFLALVAGSAVVVAWSRKRWRDPALGAFVALALAALLVSQAWRVEVAFEYRRIVYYLGPALVALIGLASYRLAHRRVWVAICAVAFVVVAHDSIGLRLPERLLRDREPRSQTVDALAAFREQLDGRGSTPATLLVADRCLGVQVPYVVQRPTLVSAEDWQVGYERLVPDARDATTIVEGGSEGRRVARERGVDYVLVDPECYPEAVARLGGTVVFESDELVVAAVAGA